MSISNKAHVTVSVTVVAIAILYSPSAVAITDEEYEKRLNRLEQKVDSIDAGDVSRLTANNDFNPAISIILDGVYASYKNDPEEYSLPGYALGGEAELASEGFSLGHSELILSNNIDDKFYGQITVAIAEHEGETEVELEEAFFETLAPGNGVTIRGGRFYSGIGYLNQQHEHAWDFHDAPLVYRGLFGNQYLDDGLRLSYVAPTDIYIEVGAEAFTGNRFPAGGEHNGLDSLTGFINFGGDIAVSHSWQAGISVWQVDEITREYGSHAHEGEATEVPLFEGDSEVIGVNAVYKWAPGGNYREQNLKLQFEYFERDDTGQLTLLDSEPLESSSLDAKQDGWYIQAIWQFTRGWRAGVRYDALDSDNSGSDPDVLDEAGLASDGFTPERSSIMAEWVPSEFSRIRLQYNRDESNQDTDDQLFLQYTFSIGAHGAHAF